MMPRIFICAPYRSETEYGVEQNIQFAEQMALDVWSEGGAAFCPHKNTAHFGGACPDHVWLDGCLSFLAVCDALYLFGGISPSSGMLGEIRFAYANNIPILSSMNEVIPFIRDWYYQRGCKYEHA